MAPGATGVAGTRFFGQLDRGEKLLDIREVFVERLGYGLPGDLEHRLTRITVRHSTYSTPR